MPFLPLLGLVIGIALGWGFVRARRLRKPPYLLHLEYWVYLPGVALPPQDEIMGGLVETRAIGPSEALLFSDVRLHVALVLRSKNAHVFRPDLLEPHVEATPEELATLAEARSFAKVRYISEEPVDDRRALVLLPQLARRLAEIGGGSLVYDPVGERLIAAEALRDGDPGPNVRWIPEATGGTVRTYGLRKRGLPEIETAPLPADQRWIVAEVVEQVAREAWLTGALPPTAVARAFEDEFRVELEPEKDGRTRARVHRVQAVR